MTGPFNQLPARIAKQMALSAGSIKPDVVASYLRWATSESDAQETIRQLRRKQPELFKNSAAECAAISQRSRVTVQRGSAASP